MRTKYLGDALDHWKGSLLENLQAAGGLLDLRVDPMITDLPQWTEHDFRLYAGLLRVRVDAIVRHRMPLKDRPAYFREIPDHGDIFLDPDTGIAPPSARGNACRYVDLDELLALLRDAPKRVVAVYQHIRILAPRARMSKIVNGLRKRGRVVYAVSYESPTAGILFTSPWVNRINGIHRHLRTWLGGRATNRVHFWGP